MLSKWRGRCTAVINLSCLLLMISVVTEIIQSAPVYTIYTVEECPANKSVWLEASSRLNCSTDTLNNRYHCMPNKGKTSLVEFCYIHDRLKVLKGYCMELVISIKKIDVNKDTKCDRFVGDACPAKNYDSSSAYLYPACSKINPDQGCYTSDPTCPPIESTTSMIMHPSTTGFVSTSLSTNATNNTSVDKESITTVEDNTQKSPLVTSLIVLASIVIVTVLFLAIFINCIKWHSSNEYIELPTEDPDENVDIEEWKTNDVAFFETASYKKVEEQLRKNKMVLIVGPSGSGKTAIARHLALKMKNEGWTIKQICTPKQLLSIQFLDETEKQVLVYDNALGHFNLNILCLYFFQMYEQSLDITLGQNVKLIMTSCTEVYDVMGAFETHLQPTKISLEDLDSSEMSNILKNHCQVYNISEEAYKGREKPSYAFPLLCYLFAKEKQLQKDDFFCNPHKSIFNNLDYLKSTQLSVYLCLILCLFDHNRLSKGTLRRLGSQLGLKKQSISKSLLDLKFHHVGNTYLHTNRPSFSIINKIVFKAIAAHFSKEHQKQVLDNISSSFIKDNITVCDLDRCDVDLNHFVVKIGPSHFRLLALRLYEDIKSMSLFDVFTNPCFENQKFQVEFCSVVRERPIPELKEVFLDEHLFGEIFCFTENEEEIVVREDMNRKQIMKKMEWLRHELLISFEADKVNSVVLKTRVIRWVVGFGFDWLFRLLLQLQIGCANPNIVDKKEKTRLLGLACFWNEHVLSHVLDNNSSDCVNAPLSNSLYLLRSDWKFNPFTIACLKWDTKLIEDLHTMYKADLDYVTGTGDTCLIIATEYDQFDVVKTLTSKKAKVDACDRNGKSPMYVASENNNYKIVEHLVQEGGDVNIKDNCGTSTLMVATRENNSKIVKFLLSKKANVNESDNSKNTALHLAVCSSGIVTSLLQKKAEINAYNNNKATPLLLAVQKGCYDTVKVLIQNDADIHKCDENGRSPLYQASKNGYFNIARHLINYGANVNTCDNEGISPLYSAVLGKHWQLVTLLVKKNADVNLCDRNEVSPVLFATEQGALKIVNYLVKHGADINKGAEGGRYPLHTAIENGNLDIVQSLLKAGANVVSRNIEKKTPLHIAIEIGQDKIVEMLMKKNVDVNAADINQETPLMYACKNGNYDFVKRLTNKGASIHTVDKLGMTLLCAAAKIGHKKMVEYLIRKGANVNECGLEHKTPLYFATEGHYEEVLIYLIKNEADVNICDDCSISPLHVASMHGLQDSVKYILGNGGEINAMDKDQKTPLYYATHHNHKTVEAFLKSNGALK